MEKLFFLNIGYSKYSLERLEKENKNIIKHFMNTDVYLRTRKIGELSFNCDYKF